MTPSTSPEPSVPPAEKRGRKVLLSLLIVGLLGAVAAVGTYSAFSATTTNDDNQIASGTVAIGDSFSSPLYDITNAKPGDTEMNCTTITYTGTVSANVKMYIADAIPPAGDNQWTLRVESVTGATDDADCKAGNGTATVLVNDADLYDWQQAHNAYSNGLPLDNERDGTATWVENDKIMLRVRATQNDAGGSGGVSSGLHAFIWEAESTP
jgi:predicted ribosomally synthesized peptide with SipW-like signal peptide